jgi:hypothetical protein
VFQELHTAVSMLEAVARELDPDRIDGHDAARLLEAAARGKHVCAAVETLLARRVDETKVWTDSGHRSAAHWLAQTTGETVGSASRTLETARALDALPATADAFRAGQLSETQAAEITAAAGADPTAEHALLARRPRRASRVCATSAATCAPAPRRTTVRGPAGSTPSAERTNGSTRTAPIA